MRKLLEPLSEPGYALVRVLSGLMFSFHGWQKIFGVLTSSQPAVGSQVWVGGVLELVGGTLIAAGLFTELAAFICSGMMAVAYVQFHWKLQGGENFFPAINKGEPAVIYSLLFLLIAFQGGRKFSLDRRFRPGVSRS